MIQASVPFLLFNDDCEQALAYYVEHFDAEIIEKMTFEDVGYTEDSQRSDCIANSTFKLGNSLFYAGDVVEKGNLQAVPENSRISFWLELDSREEIAALESNLISTGSVSLVALHKTLWESHYAKVQDRFGIVWELNTQN